MMPSQITARRFQGERGTDILLVATTPEPIYPVEPGSSARDLRVGQTHLPAAV
jgi:hypothetical protein